MAADKLELKESMIQLRLGFYQFVMDTLFSRRRGSMRTTSSRTLIRTLVWERYRGTTGEDEEVDYWEG